MCHPIEHPAHIQSSMTLPTPPHTIFSTLQGTHSPDTKPTLLRAKNANAQPTTPADGILISFNSIHQQMTILNTKAHPPPKGHFGTEKKYLEF